MDASAEDLLQEMQWSRLEAEICRMYSGCYEYNAITIVYNDKDNEVDANEQKKRWGDARVDDAVDSCAALYHEKSFPKVTSFRASLDALS